MSKKATFRKHINTNKIKKRDFHVTKARYIITKKFVH